jgi:gluconate 2-dehydrogenase gamma chain
MDRRKSIKTMVIGGFSIGLVAEACKGHENSPVAPTEKDKELIVSGLNRMKEEIAFEKKIDAEPAFFTADEMATITILGDIIIPRDEFSGSASDAKVPAFFEYIVKDMPEHQTPLRGGLRWLDMQCLNRYGSAFRDCSSTQQMDIVNEIAFPKKAKPDMLPGVAFFNLMRNLTASGFYTTEMGVKDLGYIGNVPNQWNGVPDEVLKQYKLAYTEKELKECISFS